MRKEFDIKNIIFHKRKLKALIEGKGKLHVIKKKVELDSDALEILSFKNEVECSEDKIKKI